MRGRLHAEGRRPAGIGNTPAYAGKTGVVVGRLRSLQKHPRVCGEDASTQSQSPRRCETPPRMRGRHAAFLMGAIASRNTPAYAGKTFQPQYLCSVSWKHPRVCGEDYQINRRCVRVAETPPRMRGRLLKGGLSKLGAGNTPAYAGKTVKKINLICQ